MRQAHAKTYPGLDLVRLGAALCVAIYHLGFWCWRDVPAYQMPRLIPFVSFGWVGVEIFFVISGFVIAFSATGKTAPAFVRSRAARLYPAVWICATTTAVIVGPSLNAYWRSLTLFPVGPWVDGAYWTLPIEMVFYSIIAIALWRSWPLSRVALGLGIYSCLFWTLKLINLPLGLVDFSVMESNEGYLLLPHFGVYFALGMVLYLRRGLIQGMVFLVFGLIAATWRSHAMHIPGAPFYVAPLVWLIAVLLITLSVFRNNVMVEKLGRWPIRTLGLMTYPLYLLHTEIGQAVMLKIPKPPLAFVTAILVLLGLAFAVLPLERAIRHLLPTRVQRESALPTGNPL